VRVEWVRSGSLSRSRSTTSCNGEASMRKWSRLFALATVFSVTLLTTNVLPAQNKTETTSKKKKKKEAESSATPAPAPAPPAAAKSTKGTPTNSGGVSDADIARAQSSGMVWV